MVARLVRDEKVEGSNPFTPIEEDQMASASAGAIGAFSGIDRVRSHENRGVRPIHLHIGGLVAVGFDATGHYLLTVSHSGRGVFRTADWVRVARDSTLAYPKDGTAVGIGPIEGMTIPVAELDSDHDVSLRSPTGLLTLRCASDGIVIESSGTI